jgi:hypothetical protein
MLALLECRLALFFSGALFDVLLPMIFGVVFGLHFPSFLGFSVRGFANIPIVGTTLQRASSSSSTNPAGLIQGTRRT